MRPWTQERQAGQAPSDPLARAGDSPGLAGGIAMVAGVIVVVGVLYLSAYAPGEATTPIGFDTPQHIWRANLTQLEGLGALVGWAPEGLKVHGDRTGLLVFASVMDGSFGIDAYRLMFSLPALTAIMVGLAAGTFAVCILGEEWWAFGVYGIAVGVATAMARTTVGSHDNAFVMGMLMAIAVAALLTAASKPARAGALLLFAGAALSHWVFAGLFLLLLIAIAILLLPGSRRLWGSGVSAWATPSGRLTTLLGTAMVIGVATLSLTPEGPLFRTIALPEIREGKLAPKTSDRLRQMRLPLVIPAAVLGAVSSWWPRAALRRWGLLTMVLWAASILPAFVAYYWLGIDIPVYRLVAFALGFPVLAAVGLTWVARTASAHLGLTGGFAGGIAVITGLIVFAVAGRGVWQEERPLMTEETVVAMSALSDYVERAAIDRPLVFLSSEAHLVPILRQVYAGVPPSLITRTRVFVGEAGDLLEGRASQLPRLAEASARTLPAAVRAVQDDALIVYIEGFNGSSPPPPGAAPISAGVWVLGGPFLVAEGTIPEVSWASLTGVTGAGLLLLFGAGAGWAWSLVPASWLARLGVAPALGAATLSVIGTIADRAGLYPRGSETLVVLITTALLGWLPLLYRKSIVPMAYRHVVARRRWRESW